MARYYDSHVKPRAFRPGDWVMCKVSLATKNSAEGTFGLTWEEPYELINVRRPGTYQLRGSNGKPLPHPWNVDYLKYYYQ